MPLDNSVHWKPLRDPHYVLASLQLGDGYQPIFVEQAVLLRVQEVARGALGQYALGLLLGQRFVCPATGSTYSLISSLLEQRTRARDEDAVAAAIGELLLQVRDGRSADVLGWYCSTPSREAHMPSALAAVHTVSFPHASQTVLVLGEGAASGAFYLHDVASVRWYHAPFHEVTGPIRSAEGAKATCIAWPDYMTIDPVVPIASAHRSTPVADTHGANVAEHRPSLWRSLLKRPEMRMKRRDSASRTSSTPPPTETRAAQSGHPAIAADAQAQPAPLKRAELQRRDTESADTSASDTPARYIETARIEGFFIVARFEALGTNKKETLWLLNEPYSGFLLTVVADSSQVLDASLHYNMHTDDAALLKSAFPEHRDLGTGTVYVREPCVDGLRAHCRRVRATGALEREWKVTPAIYLLTPAEWDLGGGGARRHTEGAPSTLEALNRQRIASLPEPIRRHVSPTARDHGSETLGG